MKRYIIAVLTMWALSVLMMFTYSSKTDSGYMLEVNRLHENVTRAVINGTEIPLAGSNSVQSIELVNMNQLTAEQARIFFASTGQDRFVILPIETTDAFVRYTIAPQKQNRLPSLILLSLTPLIALFALIKTEINVLKPLRMMSEIPEQLAKGHFQYNAPQYKSKVLHPFLWGLDMLRAKLDEQRNINLGLEKERKTLVASLSHDIKTPLSSIRTYSLAIKDGVYATQDDIRNALDVIIEKTVKIERLADELLESSVNAIEEIKVDASGHYMSELRDAIDKAVHNRIDLLRMEFNIDSVQNDCIVLVDIDRFVEVCDNIIENAVKYGDLGSLTVRIRNEESHTLILFENTGGNIPEAEIRHIFTSFYRGSNAGEVQGHGLGLYIAKTIMRAMEGDIYVENMQTGVSVALVVKQMM